MLKHALDFEVKRDEKHEWRGVLGQRLRLGATQTRIYGLRFFFPPEQTKLKMDHIAKRLLKHHNELSQTLEIVVSREIYVFYDITS